MARWQPLGVTFVDPEGEAVTVSWATDLGTLSAASNSSVIWTAPADDSGTALVNAVESDTDYVIDIGVIDLDEWVLLYRMNLPV